MLARAKHDAFIKPFHRMPSVRLFSFVPFGYSFGNSNPISR
jgi:hypothetical protein